MNTNEITRAWKDPEYREQLTDAQRALLPQSPAGLVELTDAELAEVAGGAGVLKTGP
jgi:mersacidin/lichenicidin family type 2 lantibiotic